jgi:antimicrobial peptide system SdpB family protein
MRALSSLPGRVLDEAERFDPRTRLFAAGRSVLGFAQLCMLLVDPDRVLFARSPGASYGMGCDGVSGLSLWCVSGSSPAAMDLDRALALLVFALVAAGYRPRWTCVAHWYLSFSLGASLIVPIGADQVAQIVSMLLVPMLLGDDRRWHWLAADKPLAPRWRGSAYAAYLALRCQITIIYVVAAGAKLLTPEWRGGTAMRVIFQDPDFGLPASLFHALRPLFVARVVSAGIGWTAIALELLIAVCVLGRRRARLCGLLAACLLHTAIIVLMGLFGFGLTMIATVALGACAPRRDVMGAPTVGRDAGAGAPGQERDISLAMSASTVAYVAMVV